MTSKVHTHTHIINSYVPYRSITFMILCSVVDKYRENLPTAYMQYILLFAIETIGELKDMRLGDTSNV